MTDNKDLLVFAADDDVDPQLDSKAWNILIVDDEEEIHRVTRLVLSGVRFEGHPLNFLAAHSGKQALTLIDEWGERIAIAILDVVMETDHSGLDLVRYMRETKANQHTRIILRTGQPGQAPERAIIMGYDINDYKEKAELTSQKLFSCIFSALRSYRDIVAIEESKRGLEGIIKASYPLFRMEHTTEAFAKAVLEQLSSLLHTDESLMYIRHQSFVAISTNREFKIITGSQEFAEYLQRPISAIPEGHIREILDKAIGDKQSSFNKNEYVGYFQSRMGVESVLYLKTSDGISELDRHLLEVFSTNITLAFDNVMLNQDIIDTQKEILYTIGDVVETRSHETANHVNRVAKYSAHCARMLGLSTEDIDLLQNASPMHDLGKIGIPDAIMVKPGGLEASELAIMKTHTVIGWEILKRSKRPILQAAATISLQHHENWDGTGYPNRLAAEQIHIFARITAITDVFDALSHRRIYKDAWPLSEVRTYIASRRGIQFDPDLTDLFLSHWDEFVVIMQENPDSTP